MDCLFSTVLELVSGLLTDSLIGCFFHSGCSRRFMADSWQVLACGILAGAARLIDVSSIQENRAMSTEYLGLAMDAMFNFTMSKSHPADGESPLCNVDHGFKLHLTQSKKLQLESTNDKDFFPT